jgi:hypothetical protein
MTHSAYSGRERRHFGAVAHERLDHDIDEIGWIVHHAGGLIDRLGGDVPDQAAGRDQLKPLTDEAMIGVACSG